MCSNSLHVTHVREIGRQLLTCLLPLLKIPMTFALSQSLGRCPSFSDFLYNPVSIGESSM